MPFDIDVAIVAGFLLVNLFVGLAYGRKVKTLSDYALGGRSFSTATLSKTIIATWIGGGFFASALSETYKEGLWHIVARFGDVITLFIVGYIIAPRVRRFFGKFSVAEAMGDLYDQRIRFITSIASIALATGSVAVQIKLISFLFGHFFEFNELYAVIFGSLVIVIYSAYGGIRSVTFTDVMQFCTFGVILPGVALVIWSAFDSPQGTILQNTASNPLFDLSKVFDLGDMRFYSSLFLFLYYTIPGLDPATFHRILIAKDTNQVQNSFIISAILCLFVGGVACLIGIALLSHNAALDPDYLVMYLVDNYSYVGLKGLTLVGIMAMIMSTADSYLNSASVIFCHDFCKTVGINLKGRELFFSRFISVIIGVLAIVLAISADNLFELLLLAGNFYTPLITMPLMVAIFGFRTTPRVILISISMALITIMLWRVFIQPVTSIDSIIPGTFVNLITIFISHYLLKEKGGWEKNKFNEKNKVQNRITNIFRIRNFKIINCFNNEFLTTNITHLYFVFGSFLLIMSSRTIEDYVYNFYHFEIHSMQICTLILSSFIVFYSMFFDKIPKVYLAVACLLTIFICFVVFNTALLILSGISSTSLVVFVLNLIMVCILLKWRVSLLLILSGTFLAYQICTSNRVLDLNDFSSPSIKISYVVVLIVGFMLMFLKPKQDYIDDADTKIKILQNKIKTAHHDFKKIKGSMQLLQKQFKEKEGTLKEKEKFLLDQLKIRSEEVSKLSSVKDEFIRNLTHESNTPMTSILSLSDILYTYYDKLDKTEIKQSIKDIVKGGERLQTYINSITDLSKLSSLDYKLKREKVNLSQLVKERPFLYKKLFSDECEQQSFVFDVQPDISVSCDRYYITQVLDNLISNAVKYGRGNPVRISLRQNDQGKVSFEIRDEGIGIPTGELISIFDKFTVSSKTTSPAEGRGVGLALVHKIITMHGGRIWAESDGKSWSVFRFAL